MRAMRRSRMLSRHVLPLLPLKWNRISDAVHLQVTAAQRRQPIAAVLLGIAVVADADERLVEQADDGRQHLLARHAALGHVPRDGLADARKQAGEVQDALVLVAVAHLAPIGMIDVLLAAARIPPRRLDMPGGPRTDPHVRPGGRYGQRPHPLQRVLVGDRPAVRVTIAVARCLPPSGGCPDPYRTHRRARQRGRAPSRAPVGWQTAACRNNAGLAASVPRAEPNAQVNACSTTSSRLQVLTRCRRTRTALRSRHRAVRAGVGPGLQQRAELLVGARRRRPARPRVPAPLHQAVLRHVLEDRGDVAAAVASRVLELRCRSGRATCPPRPSTPAPASQCGSPGTRAGSKLAPPWQVLQAMPRRAVAILAAHHQRLVRSHLVALARPLADGMAVHAARMLQNLAGLLEQGNRARLRVGDAGEARDRPQLRGTGADVGRWSGEGLHRRAREPTTMARSTGQQSRMCMRMTPAPPCTGSRRGPRCRPRRARRWRPRARSAARRARRRRSAFRSSARWSLPPRGISWMRSER